jgi:hypothetical protein
MPKKIINASYTRDKRSALKNFNKNEKPLHYSSSVHAIFVLLYVCMVSLKINISKHHMKTLI